MKKTLPLSIEAAEAKVKELKAAGAAIPAFTSERVGWVAAILSARAELRAALRAAKIPRTRCAQCGKLVRPGVPVVVCRAWGGGWKLLCNACDRKQEKRPGSSYAYTLPEDQQPCPICARPMYFRRWMTRPIPCSYQCAYRDKIAKQLKRRKVEPRPKVCRSCGKSFTPKRADAITCGNACRQRLFRQKAP
jgi:hypothetical protein